MIDFGMTQQSFRANYFEKKCLLLRAALQSRPFAWSDVDEALFRIDPVPPYFKLFKQGEVAAREFVTEAVEQGLPRRRIVKAKFYEHLRNGATAVMNRLELSSLAAQRLCQCVGRFAGHPTISNAYLSFGGNGTFGKHWDTHDVFAIQLLGTKRWQVFAPTWSNPLSNQTSQKAGQPTTQPVLDCELSPGDVLYLPRGWWHQAIPGKGPSFHLSVGTYASTAMEFVSWVCHRRLPLMESARAGLTGDPNQAIDVDGIIGQLTQALRDPQALAAFHRSLGEREQVHAEFDLQTLASPLDDIPGNTTVRLNSCYPIAFNGPHITINGAELKLESLRRVLVLHLDKTPEMTLDSLYACAPAVPHAAVRAALYDLAQYDLLTIRRPS
jgi:ribosomal protein L16 Arg81 hydroxylase